MDSIFHMSFTDLLFRYIKSLCQVHNIYHIFFFYVLGCHKRTVFPNRFGPWLHFLSIQKLLVLQNNLLFVVHILRYFKNTFFFLLLSCEALWLKIVKSCYIRHSLVNDSVSSGSRITGWLIKSKNSLTISADTIWPLICWSLFIWSASCVLALKVNIFRAETKAEAV